MANNKSFGDSLGNPAPLGLVAFGSTTFYLMTVDMGWASVGHEDLVAANAFYYGGLCQLLVGIFELLKGSSFSFLVFGSYGAFWMGFAQLHFMTKDTTTSMGEEPDSIGKTMYLLQWTVLTTFFTYVAQRKNRSLIILLGLLATTFGLLTISSGTSSINPSAGLIIKRIAGYFGFVTAIKAYYMAFAEIINEEWGRHVLPGLKPLITVGTMSLSSDNAGLFTKKHMFYNSKTNTLMLSFRGLQILSLEDAQFICSAIEKKILKDGKKTKSAGGGFSDENATETSGPKVHVVVDYQGAVIANDIADEYWQSIALLQKKYYLSAARFGVSSFGTNTNDVPSDLAVRKLG